MTYKDRIILISINKRFVSTNSVDFKYSKISRCIIHERCVQWLPSVYKCQNKSIYNYTFAKHIFSVVEYIAILDNYTGHFILHKPRRYQTRFNLPCRSLR